MAEMTSEEITAEKMISKEHTEEREITDTEKQMTEKEMIREEARTSDVKAYLHQVQYYETDGMKIVHHSNYIRWMEEARSDYLSRVGIPYDWMEENGILIPVLGVSCTYRSPARFGDTVKIFAQLEEFTGLRFQVSYRITNMDESVIHAEGTTAHCFLNDRLRPVNVRKAAPKIYEYFSRFQPKKEV